MIEPVVPGMPAGPVPGRGGRGRRHAAGHRPSGLPPGTYAAIPMLLVWFVLGYAFYSMLYGSLGSLASRTEDAQAAAGPVIIVLVAAGTLASEIVSNGGR